MSVDPTVGIVSRLSVVSRPRGEGAVAQDTYCSWHMDETGRDGVRNAPLDREAYEDPRDVRYVLYIQ